MQMLPPTVAVFQILKEARNARQHWSISGEAIQSDGQASVELRHRAGGRDRKPALADRQRWPFQVGEIDQPAQMACGSENSQVPPASQASPAVQTGNGSAWADALLRMVFRSMDTLRFQGDHLRL